MGGDNRAMEYMKGRKIMEINPESPVIKSVKARFDSNKESVVAKDMVELLYETSLITSGFQIEEPKAYAGRVYEMMANMSADSETVVAGSTPASSVDESESKPEAVTPEVVT